MLGFFLDYQTHELIDQNLPNQYNLHILKQTPLKYSKIELNLTRVFTYSLPKPTKRTPNMQLFSLLKKPNILQLQRWMFQWSNTITTSKFALFNIYIYIFFFKKTLCLRANSSSWVRKVASCSFIISVLIFATFSPTNRYWSYINICQCTNQKLRKNPK